PIGYLDELATLSHRLSQPILHPRRCSARPHLRLPCVIDLEEAERSQRIGRQEVCPHRDAYRSLRIRRRRLLIVEREVQAEEDRDDGRERGGEADVRRVVQEMEGRKQGGPSTRTSWD